jgi:phosphate transport system substrate-binding protein
MEKISVKISPKRVAAATIVASLALAACGSDEETTDTEPSGSDSTDVPGTDVPATDVPATDGGEGLSGDIVISGSSTVEPISVRVQELFNETNPDVNISVDGPGTGDGFALFCAGETDISDASRAIKDEEAATCAENGIEFTELQVGIDGLAVVTSSASPIECLSFADIYALVGPESTGFSSWADANALSAELGGAGALPDAPLDIFGPGEESGTYDSFVELVIEEFNEDRGQEAETRPDYNPSGDDNVIIQGIQGSDTSLGWVGYAFASNATGVKLVEVDGGDGCVAATPEAIASGEYPIARPLFIYVNNAAAADKPQLKSFVDFYVETGLDQAVSEVGYVALADDAKAATRSAWAG